jgi:hypothetical protein
MLNRKTLLTIIIIAILLAGNLYFGFKYFTVQKELSQTQAVLEVQIINEKVLNFTKLFIAKVLRAEKEIDFEARLKLETAVRGLNDQEILLQWQRFTESKTEDEAQNEVKNLLEILISKINVQ